MLRAIFIIGVLCTSQVFSYNGGFWGHSHDDFEVEARSAAEARDVEEVTEKDREPLAHDYKDPDEIKRDEEPTQTTKYPRPKHPQILPGGVIDVDAAGHDIFKLGSFPLIPKIYVDSGNEPRDEWFDFHALFVPFPDYKPWWKGENVCIKRLPDDENATGDSNDKKYNATYYPKDTTSLRQSNCEETPTKYECTTKIKHHGIERNFIVQYKCCYGYTRSHDSTGCTKKIDMVPLLDTIEKLKEKEFKNLVQTASLEARFKNENFTVFVPSNDALSSYSESMNNLNEIDIARRRRQTQYVVSTKQFVLNHIVPDFQDLTELENEQMLYSENNKNSIRINIYPTRDFGKMVTTNCAKVLKENTLASNGIVHVIDGVISPVTQSILEIIAEHPQLSHLRKALENTNLTKNFKPNGHYTIFAPIDSAFNKLEEETKQRLLNGGVCADTILKNHVVAHTVCTAAVNGHATTHNVDGELLNLQRTDDGVIYFQDKAKVTKGDIVATNGVIHLIDTVAIPDAGLHITESLKKENFTKFLKLIDDSGLRDEIDSLKNVTVFAPSDDAFEEPEAVKVLEDIKNDKQKIRDLIMYHTTQGQLESCNMNNDMQVKTINDKSLHLNLYTTLPIFSSGINRATVNCARITGFDEKSCASMIHQVNKILTAPSKTLLDIVYSSDKYKTLAKIIKGTETEKILKDDKQALTFLAPTDDLFALISERQIDRLMKHKEEADALLKRQILTEVLCCSGIGPHTWGFNTFVSTLTNENQPVLRIGNQIKVGTATLSNCDNVAINGVLHSVNRFLYPLSMRNPGLGFLLFGL